MFAKILQQNLKNELAKLGFPDVEVKLTATDNPQFGDFTSNIALQLSKLPAKKAYQSPLEIAKDLIQNLPNLPILSEVQIAGPGFLNFYLKDQVLIESLDQEIDLPQAKTPQKYLVEYAGPNLSKEFHIGHLRNLIFGEALARLIESAGNPVFRATYSSDIGLPLAKTLWGVEQLKDQFEQIKQQDPVQRLHFLGEAYVKGSEAYELPDQKSQIDSINKKIYQRSSQYLPLWQMITSWSLEYLADLYQRMGTHFDGSFLESEVEEEGKKIVLQNLGRVFKEDQGAVIFPGEDYGLHNRVFISSQGNATYEAKEVGLAFAEEQAFPFDLALHIVGSEQSGYFEVVLKAIEAVDARFKDRKRHISYGLVSLTTGKMSSRKGNIVTAEQLLQLVKDKVKEVTKSSNIASEDKIIDQITVGAVKFYMLKYAPATDISFDIDQSVSLEGDSGPYLQYTYARTQSLLRNSRQVTADRLQQGSGLEPEERNLLRLMLYFPLAIEEATQSLNPTPVCTYLLTLAKAFNLFYQKYPILKSSQAEFRLDLTKKVGQILAKGLFLLGIEAPDRM